MKIIGICGSPKKENSTTLYSLKHALKSVEKMGLESKLIKLADYSFSGCIACNTCREGLKCSIQDDFSQNIVPELVDEQVKGIIFASPVYFGGVTSLMKSFIDRCLMFRRNNFLFEDKVAGVITVGKSRHGGQELCAMDLVKNCLIHGMIVVPDASPTSHFGGQLWSGIKGGIENDEMGLKTAANLGRKIADTVKKLYS